MPSTSSPIHYPDWKAPAEDSQLLIWPDPARLLQQTGQNQARLSDCAVRVQGVPLQEVRRAARQFLNHPDDQPLLATGHQTELYHPGVWVKDVVIDAAARSLRGRALHIAVDTDAPKHLLLRWPGGAVPITDDESITSAAWSGLLPAPSPVHLDTIEHQLAAASKTWSFQPMVPEFIRSMRRLSLESESLSISLLRAVHELDSDLGLASHSLHVSPVWSSAPFLLFVHHILARAAQFAADYNAALHEYRAAHDLRTSTRPMPDLYTSDESIEVPFWLDDLGAAARARPSVFRSDGGFVLQLLSGEQFHFDPAADGWDAATRLQRWLTSVNHRIAARALTLTTFFRLCVVDQFVHGIGGARYDQVTDRLIERHFGIEPPRFSVATATLRFPDSLSRQRVCVPCVMHEGHRLRHALLGERKAQLVRRIEQLPRRSRARQEAFAQMRWQLDDAASKSGDFASWREKLERVRAQQRLEEALFDRELFYAIQPRARLLAMIARVRDGFHS